MNNLEVFRIETEALKKMSGKLYKKYEYRYESLRKDHLIQLRNMKIKLEKEAKVSEQDVKTQLELADRFIELGQNFERDFTIMSEG